MKALSKFVSTSGVSLLVVTSPVIISGTNTNSGTFKAATIEAPYYTSLINTANVSNSTAKTTYNFSVATKTVETKAVTKISRTTFSSNAARKAFEVKLVIREATTLYDSMNLEQTGLNEKAFEYAWRGYHNLVKRGILNRTNVLTICDFSQSAHQKRLYVIDVAHRKLLFNTYVAHGMNSGVEYATSFSNKPESFKSSLGFYVTRKTYFGRNGLSLKVNGLEKGYNDMAMKRNIVLHGSPYMDTDYMENNGELGRSLGCPALPTEATSSIIKTIKNGSCLFIYHPTKQYLNHSAVING